MIPGSSRKKPLVLKGSFLQPHLTSPCSLRPLRNSPLSYTPVCASRKALGAEFLFCRAEASRISSLSNLLSSLSGAVDAVGGSVVYGPTMSPEGIVHSGYPENSLIPG